MGQVAKGMREGMREGVPPDPKALPRMVAPPAPPPPETKVASLSRELEEEEEKKKKKALELKKKKEKQAELKRKKALERKKSSKLQNYSIFFRSVFFVEKISSYIFILQNVNWIDLILFELWASQNRDFWIFQDLKNF